MENLKFNKLLNEKYYLMQDIAKKYDYSEELLDMITLAYVSFYMDYGKKVDMPLYDLFDQVQIVYEPGNVAEIALRHGFGEMDAGTAAVTYFLPNLEVFKDQSLKQNPQIILLGTHVQDYLATTALKLEMIVHEVRHALMGYYNTNFLIGDDTYYMRSGLQETFYKKDETAKGGYKTRRDGRTLDEILNTYISELLVNRIKSFSNYDIDNANLRRYVKNIKTKHEDNLYRAIGYHSDVKLFHPVLLEKEFIDFVSEHQFIGDIEVVKEYIETLTNKMNYLEFCNLLDTINVDNPKYPRAVEEHNMEFVSQHIEHVREAKEVILDIKKSLKRVS